MPDSDWWHKLFPNPKEIIESLNIPPHSNVIDICCGDGYFTQHLSQNNDVVFGLDLDDNLLEMAKRNAEAHQLQNIHYIKGDAMKFGELIPIKADFILIANTFHGIPEKTSFCELVHSKLNNKAKFCVINWNKIEREKTTVIGKPRGPRDEMRISPEELRKICSPLFQQQSIIELAPYHYASIFQKI
eukprot:TRINITY_DN14440_c0_g1_i1.p1 TRINITY_DN14440_c0_g1~~TRINITY_DN14440_c0_g1_i1.p1  ORF type:complete len:187 (+),score=39.52 TRINITY_DN14440_c0_g1_i1:94-654(+)